MFKIDLCMPAMVYMVLALIGTMSDLAEDKRFHLVKLLMNLVVIAVVTYGLNFVCRKYATRYAWYTLAVLAFLPLVLAMTFFVSRKMIR